MREFKSLTSSLKSDQAQRSKPWLSVYRDLFILFKEDDCYSQDNGQGDTFREMIATKEMNLSFLRKWSRQRRKFQRDESSIRQQTLVLSA